MARTLAEAFELNHKKSNNDIIDDYNIFKDKELLDKLRRDIIEKLIDSYDPSIDLKQTIYNEIDKSLEGYDLSNIERNHIFHLIDNEINGFGPITELLDDDNVTEIMINGPKDIYIEIDGKILKDETISFINDDHIIRTVERMIQPLGKTIDSLSPMVDSRLPDGSRINAIIPPLSVNGPVVTIRKFKKNMDDIEDLLRNGTLTPYMARFLEAAVMAKLNIIVCGGTGSGKTTILNVLSSFISNDERIVTIEDAAELKLNKEHIISLETRGSIFDSNSEVTIRDLVRNSLRMRPDRIIVGEVRGKEAFDMLQAMNTGHDGSLTTIHANSPIDALNRLETLVLMSGMEIPVKAIREYIENAIDLVIQIERLSDGRRKITSISEVVGFKEDDIKLKEIFAFRQTGVTSRKEVDGEFILYNYVPRVYDKIVRNGITSVDDIFENLKRK